MARIIRIDNVIVNGENISVQYTAGTAPLPLEPSGTGFDFTRVGLAQAIEELENQSDEMLVKMRLAASLRTDPTISNPAGFKNKLLTLDLTGAASVIALT